MSRIAARFTALQEQGRKGLIAYLMAGDPDVGRSLDLIDTAARHADIVEIGMPFTDPMADGPVIQAAGLRSLANGVGVKDVLELLQQFRSRNTDTPVVLMGYYNPVLAYGPEKFCTDAAQAGADGLIIVDLPPEEAEELLPFARAAGLDLIRLITPTTTEKRLEKVLDGASGFLYYVSVAGVTGSKSADANAVAAHLEQIKHHTDLPIAAGFGIRTPQDAKAMTRVADAAVIGSALVQMIADNPAEGAASLDATLDMMAVALHAGL